MADRMTQDNRPKCGVIEMFVFKLGIHVPRVPLGTGHLLEGGGWAGANRVGVITFCATKI